MAPQNVFGKKECSAYRYRKNILGLVEDFLSIFSFLSHPETCYHLMEEDISTSQCGTAHGSSPTPTTSSILSLMADLSCCATCMKIKKWNVYWKENNLEYQAVKNFNLVNNFISPWGGGVPMYNLNFFIRDIHIIFWLKFKRTNISFVFSIFASDAHKVM